MDCQREAKPLEFTQGASTVDRGNRAPGTQQAQSARASAGSAMSCALTVVAIRVTYWG